MNENRRLDEVSIFNDKLRFLIPHEWVEVEDGEPSTCMYSAPNAQSGWFRVSLVSKTDIASPSKALMEYFGCREPEIDSATGNYVVRMEKDSEEDGCAIHIYHWLVAGSVPPSTICEAVFSYTVVADDVYGSKSEVEFIDKLVRQARFA